MQAMGDVDNAHATPFKFPHHTMQAFHFAVAQRGGRFIHNDEFCVQRQRPRNFHHLLLRHAQSGHSRGWRNVQLQVIQNHLRFLIYRLFVNNQVAFARFASEKHILGDGHIGQQIKFLINCDNALVLPLNRRVFYRQCFAVEPNIPACLRLRARQRFQQGRFSGTVLT